VQVAGGTGGEAGAAGHAEAGGAESRDFSVPACPIGRAD
jgi:hypothetical protein